MVTSSTRIFESIDFNEFCCAFAIVLFVTLWLTARLFSFATLASFPFASIAKLFCIRRCSKLCRY